MSAQTHIVAPVNLFDATFVVIDLETSGGSPKAGVGITEIGALKIRRGEILDEFETFVNPGSPIPGYITDLTGISDHMVADAPTMQRIFPELFEFLGTHEESIIVAHNAPFDLGFLKAAALDNSHIWPAYSVVDTALVARHILTRDEAPNCKLVTLADFFNASVSPTHRALDDARATVDVLHGLFERLATFGISTVEDLFEMKKKVPRVREKRVY
ncbi:unannotated protein [freshwater metagenome]|uniref:Unannotated protein n=1 Tax=freshwater metagenome TaxID=449393 RepID=A0A6J7XQJ0_9ZZZZ|nr:DNA polymerase III subunit epsilon [Actinomycetota bacterium]